MNWPRLLPLMDIVHYGGPGFRSAHNGKGIGIPALDSRRADALYAAKKAVAAKVGVQVKTRARAPSKLEEIEMGTVGVGAKSRLD